MSRGKAGIADQYRSGLKMRDEFSYGKRLQGAEEAGERIVARVSPVLVKR